MKVISQDRIYQLLILALILLLLWKWNCGGQHCPTLTTTITTDSSRTQQPKDSSAWSSPQPVTVIPGKIPEPRIIIRTIPGTNRVDTLYQPVDTTAILYDYFSLLAYDTTYHFKDGDIQVQNTVTQNKLVKQRVLPTFNTLTVTNTITKAEAKRRQIYLGLSGIGGKQFPLYGAGLSLAYKDRKDRMYEAGPWLIKDQGIMIQAGVKFLISFK